MRKPTPQEIEKFIQKYGYQNLEEIANTEVPTNKVKHFDDEMAFNLGYVWCNLYEVYFSKNNSSYSTRDEEILEYLRGL